MKKLTKKYRKSILDIRLAIVKQFFSDNKIVLDKNIEQVVYLLYVYGFCPSMSCEGHVPPYKKVSTFRQFWPYVQIIFNNKVEFDLPKGDQKARMRTESELDHYKVMQRLQHLLVEFNDTYHPFYEKHLELNLIHTDGINGAPNYFEIKNSLEKHYNLHMLLCDVGVQGILMMPQELLNDDFRKKFLKRTQRQITLFAKFLEWHFVESGIEAF